MLVIRLRYPLAKTADKQYYKLSTDEVGVLGCCIPELEDFVQGGRSL